VAPTASHTGVLNLYGSRDEEEGTPAGAEVIRSALDAAMR
jgi:hypothetical protein